MKPVNPDKFTDKISMYRGKYTDIRQELHQDIFYIFLKDKEAQDELKAILLGGGAGSGKSSVIEEHILTEDAKESDWVIVDSDEIKTKIPEYIKYLKNEEDAPYAAFYVHEESTHIAKQLINECIKRKLSFIYDGTMSWEPDYILLVNMLTINDYSINGIFVDIDLEIALERVMRRFEETGRLVPEVKVRETNYNAPITYNNLKFYFETSMIFNNDKEKDIQLIYFSMLPEPVKKSSLYEKYLIKTKNEHKYG